MIRQLMSTEPSPTEAWLCEGSDDPREVREAMIAFSVDRALRRGGVQIDDVTETFIAWTHSGPIPVDERTQLPRRDPLLPSDPRIVGRMFYAHPSIGFQVRANQLYQLTRPYLRGGPRADLAAMTEGSERSSVALLEAWLSAAVQNKRTPTVRVEVDSEIEGLLARVRMTRLAKVTPKDGPPQSIWEVPPSKILLEDQGADLPIGTPRIGHRGRVASRPDQLWSAAATAVILWSTEHRWKWAIRKEVGIIDGTFDEPDTDLPLEDAKTKLAAKVRDDVGIAYTVTWSEDRPGWWTGILSPP